MGYLSILLALLIIGLIYYYATQSNKKASRTPGNSYLKQTTVDASNYKGTLDSVKKTIKDAEASRSQAQ